MLEMITGFISLRDNTKDRKKRMVWSRSTPKSNFPPFLDSLQAKCVCVCIVISAIRSIHSRGC